MLSSIIFTLRWSLSVALKLARVVPGYTFFGIAFMLVSQGALLLAFFLPLKVMILLGSSDIPRYFPLTWQEIDRNYLVAYLTAGAIGFYALYLLAEKLVATCGKYGAKRLLEKSKKITLFANQYKIATESYIRYSRTLAAGVFSILVMIFIGLFYPNLVFLLVSYGTFIFIVMLVGSMLKDSFQDGLIKNINSMSNVIAALGFMLAFVFMVYDFLFGNAPGMIVAIICLLLIRQMMNQLSRMTIELSTLFSQRLQINALFFHGQVLSTSLSREEQTFWGLLESGRIIESIPDILTEIVNISSHRLDCNLQQTGIPDVVAYKVTAYSDQEQVLESYLVKVFNSNKTTWAIHEASLFMNNSTLDLPSLKFLGVSNINEYHCHIFLLAGMHKINVLDLKKEQLLVLEKLYHYIPDVALVERYGRSKHSLSQRLSENMFKRLRLIATSSGQLEQVVTLEKNFELMQSRLELLPMQIVNLDITADTVLSNDSGKTVTIHWGKWVMEPLGSGWPTNEYGLSRLNEVFLQAKRGENLLASFTVDDVKLAALMFAFEYYYLKQQFVQAMEMLPLIVVCLDKIEASISND